MKVLKILDLCAGTGSATKAFKDAGHEVIHLELDPSFNPEICMDIRTFAKDPTTYLPHGWMPDVIWASPPCFTGDTLVLTMRGHIPIRDIHVGDYVLTHKCRWRKVTDVGRKEVNAIKALYGWGTDVVRATANHPFLARIKSWRSTRIEGKSTAISTMSESNFIEAKEMVGKMWAIPLSAETIQHDLILDPYIIGRWLGDGWASTKRGEVTICTSATEADEFEAYLYSTGLKWIRSDYQSSCPRFTVANESLAWWLLGNFRGGSESKVIPGWVFGADDEVRKEILRGYLDADGHQPKPNVNVASSVSKALAHGIQLLSITLGKTATIVHNKSRGETFIEGRKVSQADSWTVTIRERNSSKIHLVQMDDGLGYGKVRSAEWISGKTHVYDITVDEDHTYTANNIVVHNCTSFSMAGSGKGRVRWDYLPKGQPHPFYGPRVPIHEVSRLGCEVVLACLEAIEKLKPTFWWLENPQGGLQTMGFMAKVPGGTTVTYCQYGDTRMKPTVLWGIWPASWKPLPKCKNGSSCHVPAPRGSRTPGSTQGHKDAKTRAMVPEKLSLSILSAVMQELNNV